MNGFISELVRENPPKETKQLHIATFHDLSIISYMKRMNRLALFIQDAHVLARIHGTEGLDAPSQSGACDSKRST